MEKERWHQNGFNLFEVIVIRDGPNAQGQAFLDGRHQVHVAVFLNAEDAAQACADHNAGL